MVQSALRIVVGDALSIASKQGLPGDHHFYISFSTNHPGVQLPDYLLEQYPEEMTIVLQHEFWDLEVDANGFSVTLCFDESNERLKVPFESITSFVDPSVKFGLQFIPSYTEDEEEETSSKDKKKVTLDENGQPISNVVTLDTFRKK
jgi:hypothetical protein